MSDQDEEIGRCERAAKDESPLSACIVLETLFGPAFLGYSHSLNHGGGRFYIALGPFLR